MQEVFVECLREGGALEKADPARGPFQAFLYAVARNVARRFEEKAAAQRNRLAGESVELDALPLDEPTLSRAFDRAFAQSLLREAVQLQERRARASGERALRRIELLRRRFGDDLVIREVAKSFGVEPAEVHHEYATARAEFLLALKEVVAFHEPGATPGEVMRRCQELGRLIAG